MPVDAGHFGKLIFDDDANAVAFVGFDHGAGDGAVEAPGVDDAAGGDGGANNLCDESELFDAIDELIRELRVWTATGRAEAAAAAGATAAEAKKRPKKPRRSKGIQVSS